LREGCRARSIARAPRNARRSRFSRNPRANGARGRCQRTRLRCSGSGCARPASVRWSRITAI
jgi:hypothetical protein